MILKLRDNNAFSVALYDAMINTGENLVGHFNVAYAGGNTLVNVEATITVNGIEVPFTEALYKAVNESVAVLEVQYEQRVRKAALHLVSRSKYLNLYNAMHNAEYLIEEELDKLGMLE